MISKFTKSTAVALVTQVDRVGGTDLYALATGGAASRDHRGAQRGWAQGVLRAGAQARPASGAR
jgi:hypothetical protein